MQITCSNGLQVQHRQHVSCSTTELPDFQVPAISVCITWPKTHRRHQWLRKKGTHCPSNPCGCPHPLPLNCCWLLFSQRSCKHRLSFPTTPPNRQQQSTSPIYSVHNYANPNDPYGPSESQQTLRVLNGKTQHHTAVHKLRQQVIRPLVNRGACPLRERWSTRAPLSQPWAAHRPTAKQHLLVVRAPVFVVGGKDDSAGAFAASSAPPNPFQQRLSHIMCMQEPITHMPASRRDATL